jgi:hypothetical protein
MVSTLLILHGIISSLLFFGTSVNWLCNHQKPKQILSWFSEIFVSLFFWSSESFVFIIKKTGFRELLILFFEQ